MAAQPPPQAQARPPAQAQARTPAQAQARPPAQAQARPPAQAQARPPAQVSVNPAQDTYNKMAQKRIYEQIKYLREKNGGLKEIEYFYQGYQTLFSNRLDEIRQAKAQGKKIVGVYCNFVPIELIIAADAIPMRMCTGFSDTILTAEEVLPRNFCPLIKSSFGSILEKSPYLDLVDVVVIPTSCDGKKKLSEIMSEHIPVWIMEVPHTTNTPESRKLWLHEIRNFKKQLEKFTGNKITRSKVKKAVKILNNQRAQVHKLYNLRKGQPSIWGRDALLVTNYASYDEPERWTQHAEALNRELEKRPPVADKTYRPRILITGTPIVMPTWKVPVLIEESGGIVVVDDVCTGTKGMWDPVESSFWTNSDMMVAMADRYLMNTCAVFTPNTARLIRLKRFVQDWNVDGVIYYVIMACHTYGMEQRKVNLEMEKMNIPVLNIETDFSQEDVEQIRTRMEAFMEMIKTRHALKTGTVMDKELHPRGFATQQGSAPAMTQQQLQQKLASAPSKAALKPPNKEFAFIEIKEEFYESKLKTPLASLDLKPPGQPSAPIQGWTPPKRPEKKEASSDQANVIPQAGSENKGPEAPEVKDAEETQKAPVPPKPAAPEEAAPAPPEGEAKSQPAAPAPPEQAAQPEGEAKAQPEQAAQPEGEAKAQPEQAAQPEGEAKAQPEPAAQPEQAAPAPPTDQEEKKVEAQ